MPKIFKEYGSTLLAFLTMMLLIAFVIGGPLPNPRYQVNQSEPQYVNGVRAYLQKATQKDDAAVSSYEDLHEMNTYSTHLAPKLSYLERGTTINGQSGDGVHISSKKFVNLRDHITMVSDKACGSKTLKFAVKCIYMEDGVTRAETQTMPDGRPIAVYPCSSIDLKDPYQTIADDAATIKIERAGVYYAILISEYDAYGLRTEEKVAIHVDSNHTS